jgi:hypothetical protein
MPNIGIIASSISASLNASSYESIATTTVGAGGVASITFSSIPSTYKHLQIRYLAATNRATYGVDDAAIILNGDTTNGNYYSHWIYGNGTSATATSAAGGAGGTGTGLFWGFAFGTTATTPTGFAGGVTDILDYANTNKYKTLRNLGGYDTNGVTAGGFGGTVSFDSGLWMSTAATTSLTIKSVNGSFIQYSSFALYGVK